MEMTEDERTTLRAVRDLDAAGKPSTSLAVLSETGLKSGPLSICLSGLVEKGAITLVHDGPEKGYYFITDEGLDWAF